MVKTQGYAHMTEIQSEMEGYANIKRGVNTPWGSDGMIKGDHIGAPKKRAREDREIS